MHRTVILISSILCALHLVWLMLTRATNSHQLERGKKLFGCDKAQAHENKTTICNCKCTYTKLCARTKWNEVKLFPAHSSDAFHCTRCVEWIFGTCFAVMYRMGKTERMRREREKESNEKEKRRRRPNSFIYSITFLGSMNTGLSRR